jgi:hypothetical protein
MNIDFLDETFDASFVNPLKSHLSAFICLR